MLGYAVSAVLLSDVVFTTISETGREIRTAIKPPVQPRLNSHTAAAVQRTETPKNSKIFSPVHFINWI